MKRTLLAGLALALVASTAAAAEPTAPSPPPSDSDVRIRPGLDVIAGYAARRTEGPGTSAWFHAFDLPRAQVIVDAEAGPARARVVAEAVRSVSGGALFGVAGDSLVLRMREARAGFDPVETVHLDAGLVPTLTIAALDAAFVFREVGPSLLEASRLASPADLGATARLDLPRQYGWVAIGAYDGEGYDHQELNRGKNVEAAANVHPAPGTPFAPLTAVVSYTLGSTGVSLARADRLTGAVLWDGERYGGGASFTYGWGDGDDGTRRPLLGEITGRAEPLKDLLLAARGALFVRDAQVDTGNRVLQVTGAIGYRLAPQVTAFAVVTRQAPTASAEAALPGSRSWTFAATARVRF